MIHHHLAARRRQGRHLTDDFNRADAATLGANWTNRVATGNQLILTSNRAGAASSGAFGISTHVTPMLSNNVKVTGVIGTSNTDGEARVLYLNGNNSNQILAHFQDNGSCDIGMHSAAYSSSGSYTLLGTGTGVQFTSADSLSFECSNGVYIARVNGAVLAAWAENYVTPKYPFADTSHREVGIGVDGATANDGFDSFDAMDISAASDGSVKGFISHDAPDQAWFNQAWDAGYRLFVVDTTNTDRDGSPTAFAQTSQQLGYALTAGLKVAAYSRDPSLWSIGIGACAPYTAHLQFWAVDIEPSTVGATYPYTTTNVDAYLAGATGLGVRPVIFSGWWAWVPGVVGTIGSAYSAVPLWDGEDDVTSSWKSSFTPSLAVPTFVPFGGWTTRIGVEQCLSITLNGHIVDACSFDPSFLTVV